MKKHVWQAGTIALLVAATGARATNGDNLEAIGAVSGALGGTGVAAPQDSLTAVVNNPAGLGFAAIPTNGELSVGVTLFQPKVSARIATPGGTLAGGSDDPLSVIPFLGYGRRIGDRWTLGLGAYGVSGMGTDYRGKGWDLDGDPGNGYEGDVFTKFSSLKVSPAVSFKPFENLSIGAAIQGNYSTLDLGQGESDDFGVGALIGVTFKAGSVQFGASYTTPQKATFEEVYNFDAFAGDTTKDTLALEQPAAFAGGVAWEPTDTFLIEFNARHLAWADADGYGDFDWENQWVFGVGAQYKATDRLALRAGFNYGKNPVADHQGWDPMGISTVQGKQVPTFGYELLRNVGFPAIVESHLTLGFGYQVAEAVTVNVAYVHAFEKEISSVSAGGAIGLESSLSEDSFTVGLAWAFN